MFVFVLLGILIFAVSAILLVNKIVLPVEAANAYEKQQPEWLKKIKKSHLFTGMTIAILLIMVPGLFFYARPGHQYYLVYPTGGESTVFTQGFKWKGFAKVLEWEKFVDVKNVKEDEPTEGITGVISGGIPIRFIDQVRATVYISARFQMPQDPETFMALAKEFRHPMNLINNTLIPTVKEQVINTGYMFAAQNYISGAASDFRQTLDEQLKNGGYSVERKEFSDTIWSNIQVEGDRQIKEIKTTYQVTKRKKGGVPIRIPHDIVKNGIITSQVIVDNVFLEKAFQQRLEKQRDISAQKRVEIEMIETLKAEQKRIAAQGERDKTKERVEQEKEQVKTLIAIETKLKQEETNKKLAAIQLETSKLQAQKVKVDADAKQYELTRADGLSEEVKFIEEQKTKRISDLSEAIKQAKWPTSVVTTGDQSGSENGLLTTLIGADLAAKISKNTK